MVSWAADVRLIWNIGDFTGWEDPDSYSRLFRSSYATWKLATTTRTSDQVCCWFLLVIERSAQLKGEPAK